jgi:hypothetical protein
LLIRQLLGLVFCPSASTRDSSRINSTLGLVRLHHTKQHNFTLFDTFAEYPSAGVPLYRISFCTVKNAMMDARIVLFHAHLYNMQYISDAIV